MTYDFYRWRSRFSLTVYICFCLAAILEKHDGLMVQSWARKSEYAKVPGSRHLGTLSLSCSLRIAYMKTGQLDNWAVLNSRTIQ